MAADVVPYFAPQFLDNDGLPLAGGLVYTYKAQTTTPLVTYSDANFTQNTNPIVLDSAGRANIYIGSQPVKFVVHDASDVLIKTYDNVTGPNGSTVGVQTVVPITTDGVTTTFDLGVAAEVPQNCSVVVQPTSGDRIVYMTSEYSVDGNNLVFDTAPPAGVGEIRVGHTRAVAAAGLSDGVVSTIKIQDLAVTNAKLAENSVGTSKIQDNSITHAKMTDDSVGTAEIQNGAVTQAKLGAKGQQVSSSSGSFTTSSTSMVDVTNLSVTITTTGRPVFIGLISDGNTISPSRIGYARTGSDVIIRVEIARDGSGIAGFWAQLQATGATSVALLMPCSSVWHLDTPAAGTYTYKLQAQAFSSTPGNMAVTSSKIVAFEL